MKDFTTKALIFSATMIVIFTIVMIIIFCTYQAVPDVLIGAFFGAFSLEGGYCAFIQKLKKEAENKAENEGDEYVI